MNSTDTVEILSIPEAEIRSALRDKKRLDFIQNQLADLREWGGRWRVVSNKADLAEDQPSAREAIDMAMATVKEAEAAKKHGLTRACVKLLQRTRAAGYPRTCECWPNWPRHIFTATYYKRCFAVFLETLTLSAINPRRINAKPYKLPVPITPKPARLLPAKKQSPPKALEPPQPPSADDEAALFNEALDTESIPEDY